MAKRTNASADTDLNTGTTGAAAPGGVPQLDEKSRQLLAALAELGEATAAGLAEQVGIGYSTTTPKLRKLHDYGLAVSAKAGNGQTVWRLTDAGTAHAAAARAEDGATDGEAAIDTSAEDGTADPEAADGLTVGDVTVDPETTEFAAAEDATTEDEGVGDGPAKDADESAAAATDTVAAENSGADYTGSADTATKTTITDGDGDPEVEDGDGAADEAPADPGAVHDTDGGDTEPLPVGATSTDEPSEADTPADSASASADVATDHGGAAPEGANGTPAVRRAPGSLDKAILAILRARPADVFKVGELCKLINNVEAGTGVSKASPGAVVLAAQRLVARRQAILAVEKPASFQYLPGTADQPASAAQPDAANAETGADVATAG